MDRSICALSGRGASRDDDTRSIYLTGREGAPESLLEGVADRTTGLVAARVSLSPGYLVTVRVSFVEADASKFAVPG